MKMKNEKIFPNFWQALLFGYVLPGIILLSIILLYFAITNNYSLFNKLSVFNNYFGHLLTIPILLFFIWKSKIRLSWSEFTGIKIKHLIIIVMLTIGIEIIFYASIRLLEFIFNQEYFSYSTKSFHYLSIIQSLLFAPIIEELLYRRIYFHQFKKIYPQWLALILSTLLFVLPHVPVIVFPALLIPYFITGLFLGLVYLKTQSISLCIISHFIMNLMTYFY